MTCDEITGPLVRIEGGASDRDALYILRARVEIDLLREVVKRYGDQHAMSNAPEYLRQVIERAVE